MGWIAGYPDGTFRPDATITRAEMMTLVNRALERVPSKEDHLLSERVMLTFSTARAATGSTSPCRRPRTATPTSAP